jgi:hypothetical protein
VPARALRLRGCARGCCAACSALVPRTALECDTHDAEPWKGACRLRVVAHRRHETTRGGRGGEGEEGDEERRGEEDDDEKPPPSRRSCSATSSLREGPPASGDLAAERRSTSLQRIIHRRPSRWRTRPQGDRRPLGSLAVRAAATTIRTRRWDALGVLLPAWQIRREARTLRSRSTSRPCAPRVRSRSIAMYNPRPEVMGVVGVTAAHGVHRLNGETGQAFRRSDDRLRGSAPQHHLIGTRPGPSPVRAADASPCSTALPAGCEDQEIRAHPQRPRRSPCPRPSKVRWGLCAPQLVDPLAHQRAEIDVVRHMSPRAHAAAWNRRDRRNMRVACAALRTARARRHGSLVDHAARRARAPLTSGSLERRAAGRGRDWPGETNIPATVTCRVLRNDSARASSMASLSASVHRCSGPRWQPPLLRHSAARSRAAANFSASSPTKP